MEDVPSLVCVLFGLPYARSEYQCQSSILVGIRSKGFVQYNPVSMRIFAPLPCPQMVGANFRIQVVQRPVERLVEAVPIADPDRAQHRISLAFRCRNTP